MKKVISFALTIIGLLSMTALATEVDMDYSGILDSYTGLPQGELSGEDENRIWLDSALYYDFSTSQFVYQLGSGVEIASSVADGMVTTEAVSLTMPAGVNGKLYRNGTEVTGVDYADISTPGSYVLSINSRSGVPIEPLSFSIVNSVTGTPENYILPEGFTFKEVLFNGTDQVFSDREADLGEEGNYRLTYVCDYTGIQYELAVVVDHTPPVLELAAVEDGVAKGPVNLYDLEKGASIRIERDGKVMDYRPELTESGSYHIWIQDEAGNRSEYQFRIQVYLNVNSILFIGLFLALVLALVIYLAVSRKNLRVR